MRKSSVVAALLTALSVIALTGCPPSGMGNTVDVPASASAPTHEQDVAMSRELRQTAGALVQAILVVNTFLYTDPSVTDLATFKARHADAMAALSVLEAHAKATEALAAPPSGDAGADALPGRAYGLAQAPSPLSANDILATVSAGPANRQIRTLMQKYQVGAVQAKALLDDAMAGLTSTYNDEAAFNDKVTRTLTVVKEGAALTVTVMGGVMAAGALGTLATGDAAILVLKGVDGVIKTTKAGLELAVGKDIKSGSGGEVFTAISGASDLVSIARLWDDPLTKTSNLIWLGKKAGGLLGEGLVTIGPAGALNLTVETLTSAMRTALLSNPNVVMGDVPTALPGSYLVAGQKIHVPSLNEAVSGVLAKLPAGDQVAGVKNALKEAPAAGTPRPTATPTTGSSSVPTAAPTAAAPSVAASTAAASPTASPVAQARPAARAEVLFEVFRVRKVRMGEELLTSKQRCNAYAIRIYDGTTDALLEAGESVARNGAFETTLPSGRYRYEVDYTYTTPPDTGTATGSFEVGAGGIQGVMVETPASMDP